MFDPHLGQVDELLLRVDDVTFAPTPRAADNLRQDVTQCAWADSAASRNRFATFPSPLFFPCARQTIYSASFSSAPARLCSWEIRSPQ